MYAVSDDTVTDANAYKTVGFSCEHKLVFTRANWASVHLRARSSSTKHAMMIPCANFPLNEFKLICVELLTFKI